MAFPDRIESVYESIVLPDGTADIPLSVSVDELTQERLGPLALATPYEPVQFPTIPVTEPPPLPYGRRLPAPGLPTESIPEVPSFSQPPVQTLSAPRYEPAFAVPNPVQLPSYSISNGAVVQSANGNAAQIPSVEKPNYNWVIPVGIVAGLFLLFSRNEKR